MTTVTAAARERSPRALMAHTLILTHRLLVRWSRDPMTLAQSLVLPALLLIMLNLALGNQITRYALDHNLYGPGYDSIYGTVPMAALVGIMAGSVAGAISLGRERETGLLSRFWVLPVHRSSGLVARVLAEGVRIFVGTVVIVIVGHLFGFRFERGPLAALAYVTLPVLFGLAFATVITTIAVRTAKASLIELVSLASSVLTFFSTGFVPLDAFPEFLQGVVTYQPLTTTVDAMRGLSFGGPVAKPLLVTLIWCVGAILVFAIPAAQGYRKASRR